MLTINAVTSATDAKAYYAVADYYSEGQETVGHWGGKLAGTARPVRQGNQGHLRADGR